MCKYVHYQIDSYDLKRNFNKLHRLELFQGVPYECSSDIKQGWKNYIPIEFLESKELRLQKLKESPNTQWINCDLFNFNLKILVEDSEKYDVIIVDPPWKIHMESLPYEVLDSD